MNNKMEINFWNYVGMQHQGAADVKRWKEMGFTMAMTGGGSYTNEESAKQIAEVLTECGNQGMDAIVFEDIFDIRTYLKAESKEKYEEQAKAALKFYEAFPAAKYVFVWDEPGNDEQWNAMGEVCAIIRKYSDKIRGFSSLNHYCGQTRAQLYARLDRYVETCKPDVLLYNCYSQCFDFEGEKLQGIENYYINLRFFSEYAEKHGLTLATSLVCVGHWSIRVPTQDDIRWQLSTAAAHGVKQFYWFHPFELGDSPVNATNYRLHPVNYRGKPSATYEPLAYENAHLMADMKAHGLLEGARLEKVYHVLHSYGGWEYFEKGEDEYVYEIKNAYNKPLILSRFVRADGKRVLMIVNNAQRGFADITVVFNKNLGMADITNYLGAGSAMYVEIEK